MINQNLAFKLCEEHVYLRSSFSHIWEKDDFDLFLVQSNIWLIEDIRDPSEQVQLYVVDNARYDTMFLGIHNPCEAASLLHVTKNGFNIKNIEDPTPEMIKISLAWSKRTSYHINKFPYSLYKYWYISTLRLQAIVLISTIAWLFITFFMLSMIH